MSVYEDVSMIIAKPNAESVGKKINMNGTISTDQKSVIQYLRMQLHIQKPPIAQT